MIHPKEIQEVLVKQQVAKTAEDIFMGSSLWIPAAKVHMMAYDKQINYGSQSTLHFRASNK